MTTKSLIAERQKTECLSLMVKGDPNVVQGHIRWGNAKAKLIVFNPSSDNDAVSTPAPCTICFNLITNGS